MSCNVILGANNTPIGVLDNNGNPSKLFDAIVSNPHIKNFEEALDIYLNTDQELELSYRDSSGVSYASFKDAIKNTNSAEIEAVVGEKTLFKIDTNTDTSTYNGMVNSLVKDGIITGETYLDTVGRKVFKVAGETDVYRAVTSDMAREEVRRGLGFKAITRLPSGDFLIEQDNIRTNVKVTDSKGEIKVVNREKAVLEPINKYEESVAISSLREYKNATPAYGKAEIDEIEILPENELQRKLLNLLKSFGVKTLSITNYITNYSIKNGVEPSAQALADLGNMIVAFKDGTITTETLTEEASHFIVASLDEAQKADMKRNIHKTKQWMEHANYYREVYSKTYQGEELEDILREEILGKVLAESLINQFTTENAATPTEVGIIQRLRELFDEFINKVRAFITPKHEKDLNTFTSQVYKNLISETLELEKGSKRYTLYSTSQANSVELDKMEAKVVALLDSLNSQANELSKKYNQQGDKTILQRTRKEIDTSLNDATTKSALVDLTKVALSQVNTLNKVVDTNTSNRYLFSQEEHSVYTYFKKRTIPMVNQILAKMSKKDSPLNRFTPDGKIIFDNLQTVVTQYNLLEGKVPNANRQAVDRLVDLVIQKHELKGENAEQYRADIAKIMEVAQKDTTWLHAHLGSLSHARNGLLNLAGDVIERVHLQERTTYLALMKKFLNRLEKAGFPAEKLNRLIYKNNIINEIDPELLEKADREDKATAFKTISGDVTINQDNVDEYVTKLESKDATDAEKRILKDGYEEFFRLKSLRKISYFKEEYKEALENASITLDNGTIDKSQISKRAKEAEAFFKSQAGQIRKNANDGILSEEDNLQLRSLAKQKQQEMNPRNENGELKKGLKERYDASIGQYVLEIDKEAFKSLSDMEADEIQKIWGLNMLNLINGKFYRDYFDKKGEADTFFEKLKEFKTEKEKWEFVKNNASITFSDNFFESFRENTSLTDRLREEGSEEALLLIDEIREHQSVISNILKANKEYNEPSEIDNSIDTGISKTEKSRIKEASSLLELKYTEARSILGDVVEDVVESTTVTTTNKAYRQDLIDSQQNELEFILNNVTPNSKSRIEKVAKVAEKLKNKEAIELTGLMSRVFDVTMTSEEIDVALLEYAKSRLLPYYKRTEPIGYSEALDNVERGVENNEEGAVENYLNNPLIKVSPNFIFYATTADTVNEQWLKNKEAGREQYTEDFLERVRNEEYYNTFGISRLDPDLKPSKNLDLWEAREALLELQDASIDLLGLTGIHNRYQLPQLHKSTLRRFVTTKDKKQALRQTIYDWVGVREDDLDYGQDINGNVAKKGSSLLTIPTYGVRKIDDQNDVTDELLQSYGWFAQQAALHKARKENIGDMFALQDYITRDAAYEGKEAHAANTAKMFKSYLEANFYGVKDTFSYEKTVLGKKIDIGKIARVFNSFVRFSNLAGITVPITSLFQGKVQELLERQVGEIINPTAYNMAQAYLKKHGSDAAKEMMGFNSKSELNVRGEFSGMYNVNDRYESSGFNKGARYGIKGINGLHSLGNFPVTTTTMMSVWLDYRWVGDTIMSMEQYMRNNPDATKESWKKLDLFIEDAPVKNGVVEFNKESIAKKTGLEGEALQEWIKLKSEAISNRVSDAVQRIDSQIPEHQKSIAARHGISNFFLMHLNWFLNAMQTKFKDRHFNQAAGMYQEGNWRTMLSLINDIILKPKDIKKTWDAAKGDPVKLRNLKRTGVEIAVGNTLAIAALLLANAVDDDEDTPFAVAYADYILTRVANEQVSATLGLPNQIGNIFSDPVVSVSRAKEMAEIWDLTSSEVITKGSYAGETERMRYLYKNAPLLKDVRRLADPTQARQTYQFFNLEKEGMFDRYAFLTWLIDEEEE